MRAIVDDIGLVVAKVMSQATFDESFDETFSGRELHYLYGHRLEITKRLLNKKKVADKYPLIALILDTPEEVDGGMVHYTLDLLIIEFTKQNYNAEERYAEIIKPKLYPLYEGFMEALRKSYLFSWNRGKNNGSRWPPHIKVDRPYWGVTEKEGNPKNLFTDPLDAIQITDLKISQPFKKC